MVLLNVFDEAVSEFDKKGVEQVEVFLEYSFVVVHNDGLKEFIVDIHYIDELLEYFREDIEYLWEFGGFEYPFKGFESFENVDLAQGHFVFYVFVVCGEWIVADHSDESDDFDGLF